MLPLIAFVAANHVFVWLVLLTYITYIKSRKGGTISIARASMEMSLGTFGALAIFVGITLVTDGTLWAFHGGVIHPRHMRARSTRHQKPSCYYCCL